ncbi:MAG: Ig-like domain-containing protein [Bacteroidales bacterium]|nr:Ig-like domain-containing protein [Bacteroidales bacterium]
MRKFLRFSLVMMLICFLNPRANAQTFKFSDLYGTATINDISTLPKSIGSITISFAKGNSSSNPAYNKLGEVRLYGGKSATVLDGCTMTVTSSDKNITKIVLTCGSIGTIGELTADIGTISEDANHNITWTGSATEITFTASRVASTPSASTQNRYTQAEVTVEGEISLDPAQIAFSKTTFTAYLDGENTFPTFSNPNNLAVTFDSSDKNVATIDAEGNVTILAKGITTISATSEKTDKYEAGNVTYTLTVKPQPVAVNTAETAFTVAEALKQVEDWTASTEKVYVKGKISKIDEVSTQYGNATYFISDDGTETNQLKVFRGYYLNNEKFTAADQINVGDEVIVYGVLINYNNTTPEINQYNNLYSHNGKTTGISEIAVDNAKTSPVYNTAGQRVDSSYKGIVIKNGKKVLVK